jgi:hypothetical protein
MQPLQVQKKKKRASTLACRIPLQNNASNREHRDWYPPNNIPTFSSKFRTITMTAVANVLQLFLARKDAEINSTLYILSWVSDQTQGLD